MLALMYYSSPTNDGGLVCTYNKLWLMVPLMFSIEGHCDPEPDSEKLKCLHHFYMDNYDSNDKNCYYYWL